MARGPTDNPDWLAPATAVGRARLNFKLDEGGAKTRLLELAADGEVMTWSMSYVSHPLRGSSDEETETKGPGALPPRFWQDFRLSGRSADWTNGVFTVVSPAWERRVHGVKFSGADLDAYVRRIGGTSPAPASLFRDVQISRVQAPPPAAPFEDPMNAALRELMDAERAALFSGRGAQTGRVKPPYAAKQALAPERPGKVTKDDIRQWFPAYERSSNDFRFESVKQAAEDHFKPLKVSRRPLREIIGEFDRTRTRGKPAG